MLCQGSEVLGNLSFGDSKVTHNLLSQRVGAILNHLGNRRTHIRTKSQCENLLEQLNRGGGGNQSNDRNRKTQNSEGGDVAGHGRSKLIINVQGFADKLFTATELAAHIYIPFLFLDFWYILSRFVAFF